MARGAFGSDTGKMELMYGIQSRRLIAFALSLSRGRNSMLPGEILTRCRLNAKRRLATTPTQRDEEAEEGNFFEAYSESRGAH
jgi:hypothetical protein